MRKRVQSSSSAHSIIPWLRWNFEYVLSKQHHTRCSYSYSINSIKRVQCCHVRVEPSYTAMTDSSRGCVRVCTFRGHRALSSLVPCWVNVAWTDFKIYGLSFRLLVRRATSTAVCRYDTIHVISHAASPIFVCFGPSA